MHFLLASEPIQTIVEASTEVAAAAGASAGPGTAMLLLTVFVLAVFIGVEVIAKIPPTLHTPLMSGSNAISGIALVGAVIAAGSGESMLPKLLGRNSDLVELAELLEFPPGNQTSRERDSADHPRQRGRDEHVSTERISLHEVCC